MKDTQTTLEEAMTADHALDTCWLRRGTKKGDWITVLPPTVNGMDLGYQECRDTIFLRYGIEPPDLPNHCDGCNAKFSIRNSLDCKKGGLIMSCHNEICDGVPDLAGKASTPSHVQGCAM